MKHKRSLSCKCRDEQTGKDVTIHRPTNRIEGAWKHAKNCFKHMNGTKVTQFEGHWHLCEIMWRWWDRRPKPESILKLITQYSYPLSGPSNFTAGYPVFTSWSRASTLSPDDTMSRTRHQLTKTVTQKHSQVLPRAAKSAVLVGRRRRKHNRSRPSATQNPVYLHRWSM